MGRDEDRHAVAPRQLAENAPEGRARHRIDAGGRLVEDQHLGAVDQRNRETEALADAERQRIGQGVHRPGEVESLGHLAHPVRDAVLGKLEQARVQLEVLAHGQLGVEREGLAHVADPAAHAHVVRIDLAAKEPRRALARGQEAGQRLHRRGFAAAVRAEEAEDLAPFDAEAHMIDRGEIAEAHGEPLGLYRGPLAVGLVRAEVERAVAAPPLLGQQRDETGVEIGRAAPRHQLGRRAGGEHPPAVHRRQPVEPRRLLHVGGGDDDAHACALGADRVDQLPELAARQRVDAGGRLVEDQEVGIVDQRAAEAELLLHAPRELLRRPVGEGREAGAFKKALDPPRPLLRPLAEQPSEEIDVLAHRERGIEVPAEPLRHVGDPRLHPLAMAHIGDVAAEHGDPARLHLAGAGDERQEARLADAIGADQPDHASGRQVEGHVVERPGAAEGESDALEAGDRFAHGTRFADRNSGHSASGSSRT